MLQSFEAVYNFYTTLTKTFHKVFYVCAYHISRCSSPFKTFDLTFDLTLETENVLQWVLSKQQHEKAQHFIYH